jgi:hypothetical protein
MLWEEADWIQLAQDGDRWWAHVNTVTELLFVLKAGISCLAERLLACPERLCFKEFVLFCFVTISTLFKHNVAWHSGTTAVPQTQRCMAQRYNSCATNTTLRGTAVQQLYHKHNAAWHSGTIAVPQTTLHGTAVQQLCHKQRCMAQRYNSCATNNAAWHSGTTAVPQTQRCGAQLYCGLTECPLAVRTVRYLIVTTEHGGRVVSSPATRSEGQGFECRPGDKLL